MSDSNCMQLSTWVSSISEPGIFNSVGLLLDRGSLEADCRLCGLSPLSEAPLLWLSAALSSSLSSQSSSSESSSSSSSSLLLPVLLLPTDWAAGLNNAGSVRLRSSHCDVWLCEETLLGPLDWRFLPIVSDSPCLFFLFSFLSRKVE